MVGSITASNSNANASTSSIFNTSRDSNEFVCSSCPLALGVDGAGKQQTTELQTLRAGTDNLQHYAFQGGIASRVTASSGEGSSVAAVTTAVAAATATPQSSGTAAQTVLNRNSSTLHIPAQPSFCHCPCLVIKAPPKPAAAVPQWQHSAMQQPTKDAHASCQQPERLSDAHPEPPVMNRPAAQCTVVARSAAAVGNPNATAPLQPVSQVGAGKQKKVCFAPSKASAHRACNAFG
jgi:hypothetical protein